MKLVNRHRILNILLVSFLTVLTNITIYAQDLRADYYFIKNSNAWLSSQNASGLDNFVGKRASIAEGYFKKSNGEFINYYESDNSYQSGISSESYIRLNPKTVVYGSVNYSYFSGKNMGGATFIDPDNTPFNIIEYTDSTAGRKVKETYYLVGALSRRLSDKWTLGLNTHYKNISYFKTKDLRHTNDYMDLITTAGFRYQVNHLFDIGLNYYYRRQVESIEFKSYGNTDQQFNSLIDYGAFYGLQEKFDKNTDGYTESGTQRPLINRDNGICSQINIVTNNNISIFNELSVKFGSGYFGETSTNSIKYLESESFGVTYLGIVSLKVNESLHQLRVEAHLKHIETNAHSFLPQTDTGGVKTIEYYGKRLSLGKNTGGINIGYKGYYQIENDMPKWEFKADFNYCTRNQRVIVYPDYRKQKINQYRANISGKRNITSGANTYSISLKMAYGSGDGYKAEDGTYDSSATSKAVNLAQYLNHEYEYLTVQRLSSGINLGYAHCLKNNKLKLFGSLGYNATKAFNTEYIGDYFGSVNFKIGCQF